ncbi:MAG: ABC transporter permease [Lachnospiraceae bacterium]|nr:ABC transporter permease [Lachnospiraceae bacterium]
MKRAGRKFSQYWRGNVMFRVGFVLTAVMLLFVLIGAIHTPYPPTAMNEGAKLSGFTPAHPLGTDHLGRDMLSRLMTGAGTTLLIALGTVLIGAFCGSVIGALCGYFGGLLDESLMRIVDALFAFPSILLALLFVSLFGSGRYHVIIALGIAFIPSFARTVRGEFLRERGRDYVTSARLHGVSHLRIIFFHILPNAGDVLLSSVLIGFNNAVLAEAGLSFLGIGVQPPDASLGRMLSESQQYLFKAPMSALLPGFLLVWMILGFSLAGEGVRAGER